MNELAAVATDGAAPTTSEGPPNWHEISTEARRNIIRPLWLEGLSAGEIARGHFVNATRNAIIGYVARMKLSRGKVTARPNPQKPKAPKARKPTPARIAKADSKRERAEVPEDDMPKARDGFDLVRDYRPPLAGSVPLTLMQLPNSPTGVACRFPVQGGFCGIPPDGEKDVYCRTHSRLAHAPPRPPQGK